MCVYHKFISADMQYLTFPAGCLKKEYVAPGNVSELEQCVPCPASSVSSGGNANNCICDLGFGRVNDTDVTLPCLSEFVYISTVIPGIK